MSLVSRLAESASVRATTRVGTSATSAASRAATSVRMCWLVGTSTLPPRWPHFFSEESWSSKCTAAAPASMNDFMISYALSGAAEAGLGVGDDRDEPVDESSPSACVIWSARRSALLMRLTSAGALLAG